MLAWTDAGAVERPRVLQARLQRTYPGRVRAGAPEPTRSMSTAEVIDNLAFFTEPSPRGAVVTALVLSGVGVAARPDLPEIVAAARDRGIGRVTLHLGAEDLAGGGPAAMSRSGVDAVVVPLGVGEAAASMVSAAAALRAGADAGLEMHAGVSLVPGILPVLAAVPRIAAACRPRSVTFSYPFPVDGGQAAEVPPPHRAVAALGPVVPAVEAAGCRAAIKGLPACWLGDLAGRLSRTANRWYVDADHQRDRALLFFPGVVRFAKEEGCRFCAADGGCDGFFATYLKRPGAPRLSALRG